MKYLPIKLMCIVLIVLCNCKSKAQTTYPSGVTGCIARWNFTNNGTVVTVPDVSLNGHNATPINVGTGVAFRSIQDKAMDFNGTNSYAWVSSTTMLNPSQMTIIALVKNDGFYSGLCTSSEIISKGYPHFISGNYSFGFSDNVYDGSCVAFNPQHHQLVSQFNSWNNQPPAGNYVQTGKWYFVAASYDGNTARYYQVEMDTAVFYSIIQPFYTLSGSSTPIGTNTQNVSIGRHLNPQYPYWFDGRMDELILFNKVLTDAEVHSVYEYLWGRLTVSTNDTILCNTNQMVVNYFTYNPDHYQTGNVFTAQLSDANGSFANPVNIGSVTSIISGSINCTIPVGTPPGSGYRIRVVASNVPFISSDNGLNISINMLGTSLSLGNDTAICSGNPFTITPTGVPVGATYLWSNGTANSTLSVSTPGTYWLTVNVNGCTGSDTINITQATSLNVSLGNDITMCPGQSTSLSPSPQYTGATYIWSTGSTSSTITASAQGSYWVTVSAGGCTGSDTVNIAHNNYLSLSLGNDTAICPGQSLNLSPVPQYTGATYAWNTGSTNSSLAINTPGMYWVVVTANGCVGTDTINITQASSLALTLGNDTSICPGQSVLLSPTPQYNGAGYVWSNGSTASSVSAGPGDTYWVTVTAGGCSGSDSIEITEKVLSVDIGTDRTICLGESLTLSPSGLPTGTQYLWSNGSTDSYITVNSAGTYWLYASLNGCSGSDTTNLAVLTIPDVNLGNDTTICKDDSLVLFSNQPAGYSYIWNTGSTNSSINVAEQGVYWLTVTDTNSCRNTDSVAISTLNKPAIDLGKDTVLCEGTRFYIPKDFSGQPNKVITWQNGSQQDVFTVTGSGIYVATISDICGSVSDTVVIDYQKCDFWFPGAFSPDGNNLNDKARLLGAIHLIDDFELNIYNRYGNRVFNSNDPYAGWDGRYKGEPQPVGTYYYYIRFRFSGKVEMMKGDLTLLH
jgi:gliding motility-associated-like protein